MHRQGDICRTAQPAPTVIMKLVTRWSDQHHLDPSTPGSVCPHFLEASSRYCASIDPVLHKMEQLMSGMQSGHPCSQLFPSVPITVVTKQLRNVHGTLSSIPSGRNYRFCDSSVLIINCLNLLFCGSREAWETIGFLQARGRGHGGASVPTGFHLYQLWW